MQTIAVKPISPTTSPEVIPISSRWFGSWRISIDRQAFSETDLKVIYDREAESWENKLKRLNMQSAYREVLQDCLGYDHLRQDQDALSVLDCGTGTGELSLAFSDICERPFSLSAIDISPAMLEQAKQKFHLGRVNAETHLASATNLPFEDETFDVVMAAHMLEHVSKPFSALSEMMRVLKPGGLLILLVTRQSIFGLPIQLKWRVHALSPQLLRGWLRTYGFNEIRSHKADPSAMFSKLSLAYSARKPLNTHDEVPS